MIIFQRRVADLTEVALRRFVKRARVAAGLTGGVNVLLTTSREMNLLNRRFRKKDKPTDVLSFPAATEIQKQLAGDIAISADIATRNARALGHSPSEEVKILVFMGSCTCGVTITSATMGRCRGAKSSSGPSSGFRWD